MTTDEEQKIELPELDSDDLEDATGEGAKKWARELVSNYRVGDLHDARGIVIQKVDDETIRVVRYYSPDECLGLLAMLRTTFEAAGFKFQLEGALMTPYFDTSSKPAYFEERKEKQAAKTARDENREGAQAHVGMEVV